jgi:hypothetical protein
MIKISEQELFMRLKGDMGTDDDDVIYIDESCVAHRKDIVADGKYKRVHRKVGWTIEGYVITDWITWCSGFTATHRKWGSVIMKYNNIRATSRLGFEAFWYHFGGDMGSFNSLDI